MATLAETIGDEDQAEYKTFKKASGTTIRNFRSFFSKSKTRKRNFCLGKL